MRKKKPRGSNRATVTRVRLPKHPVANLPLPDQPPATIPFTDDLPAEPAPEHVVVHSDRYVASATVGETSVVVAHEDYLTALNGLVYCLNRLV